MSRVEYLKGLAHDPSNLAQDLLPDELDTRSLGSVNKEWLNIYIGDAGKLYFGLAQDVNLYREIANRLKTDDSMQIGGTMGIGTAPAADTMLSLTATGTNVPLKLVGDGAYCMFELTETGVRTWRFQTYPSNYLGIVDVTQGVARFEVKGGDAQGSGLVKSYDPFDAPSYKVGGVAGASGSFTTVDGKTVTVTNGIITSIV